MIKGEEKNLSGELATCKVLAIASADLAAFGLAWLVMAPNDPLSLAHQDFFYSVYHLTLLGAVFWLIWRAIRCW